MLKTFNPFCIKFLKFYSPPVMALKIVPLNHRVNSRKILIKRRRRSQKKVHMEGSRKMFG